MQSISETARKEQENENRSLMERLLYVAKQRDSALSKLREMEEERDALRKELDRLQQREASIAVNDELIAVNAKLVAVNEELAQVRQERDEARRQRDAFQQQFDEVQESMLEEHEDLTRHLADAQGEARTLRMTNTALVSSLRHVTAALNVLLDQLPEAKR